MEFIFGMFMFMGFAFMAGFGFLIYTLIQKSAKRPDAAGMYGEKQQMVAYTATNRHTLLPWNDSCIALINNNLRYNSARFTTRTAKGTMETFSGQPLLAFSRLERGIVTDGHLYAATSAFDVYTEYYSTDKTLYFNGRMLGKVFGNGQITDATGKAAGHAVRIAGMPQYDIVLNGKKLATLQNAQDTRLYRQNPHYDRRHKNVITNQQPMYRTDYDGPYNIVQYADPNLTNEEKQWVIALAIFETLYHSLEMVR